MRKILISLAVLSLLIPSISFGAISFDSTAFDPTGASQSTPYSWNYTVGSGTNRMLFVGLIGNVGTSDVITGITYNGVAMTRVASVFQATLNRTSYLYALANPATGTNAVVITPNTTTLMLPLAASYFGAKQTSVVDNSTTNTLLSGDPFTTSLTPVTDSWTFEYGRTNNTGTTTGGTGTTVRFHDTGGSVGNTFVVDSNTIVTGGSSASLIVNFGSNTAWDGIMLSFAPAVAATSTVNPMQVIWWE